MYATSTVTHEKIIIEYALCTCCTDMIIENMAMR